MFLYRYFKPKNYNLKLKIHLNFIWKETTITTEEEIKTECAVPEHSGPIASGWEANHQWKLDATRKKSLPDGHLDSTEFGVWKDFSTCLANAMRLLEGQDKFKI